LEVFDEKDKPISHVFPDIFQFIESAIVPADFEEAEKNGEALFRGN